jgi:hypothetical protein
MGADSGIKQGEVVEWADPRAELDDIKAQGIRGSELVDGALRRLSAFTRAGRWRELLTEDYATVAEFLAAEFPMLAELAIPQAPRRELVALMAGEKVPQKAIAAALGVSQQTVSGDLRFTNIGKPGLTSPDVTKCNVPKTGAERVAEHRARKREDPHADLRRELAGKGSPSPAPGSPSSAVSGTVAAREKKDPAPCPGCAGLRAKLTAAEEQIGKLRAAHPDAVLAAEKEFLRDQNAALAARVRELEAKLSAAPDTAVQVCPPVVPQTGETTADGEPCAGCGGTGAALAWERARDGEKRSGHICDRCLDGARARHPELAFSREEPPDQPVTTQAELDEIYSSFPIFEDETA